MPYIARARQLELSVEMAKTGGLPRIRTSGELNFMITWLVQRFINENGVSYTTLNEAVGVLECSKLEFYRRAVAAYEDHKKEENGDVYEASIHSFGTTSHNF